MSNVQSTVNFIPPKVKVPTKIWINNIAVLTETPTDFWVSKNQTNEERLNSIVRLSFYISFALSVYYSDLKYISIGLFSMCITYLIYTNHPVVAESLLNKKENLENSDQSSWDAQKSGNWGAIPGDSNSRALLKDDPPVTGCVRPTVANPFMNTTMGDYLNIDENNKIFDREEACDPNNPDIKRDIDADFNNNLYKDVGDIFGKTNSQRNFYTMPWTTIPNDPNHDFAKWLYKTPATCHEDQASCSKNIHEDLRNNRPITVNPNVNPV